MAISTKLQPQYYEDPWNDPNAFTGGDPNALGSVNPLTQTTARPGTGGTTNPAPAPTSEGTSGESTTTTPAGSGTGGLPVIPDGQGGTVTVPPLPVGTEPWEEATPDPKLWGGGDPPIPGGPPVPGGGGAPGGGGGGGGYGGSYPINPNATGSGRGWDELNAMFDQAPIRAGANPRLARFQSMSDEAIQKILNGPDRLGLAKSYYDIFDKETEGDYQRDLKGATNLGAARGRLGSGLLTNTYGDLFERRSADKDAAKGRLLTGALEGTIKDRQDAYRAVADAENMAFGQDSDLRDEERTERESRRKLIDDWFRQQQGAYGREFDERKYGDDLAFRGRNEERDDREYTDRQANEALLNRLKQQELELDQRKAEWDRAFQLWQMGQGPRPSGARPTSGGT